MSKQLNPILYACAILFGVGVVSLFSFFSTGILVSGANPSQISEKPFATATTTMVSLSAGTGTTTTSYDLQSDGSFSADSATFAIMILASSTNTAKINEFGTTTLNITFEYSQDNINWFADTLERRATTTTTVSIGAPSTFTIDTGNNTLGGLVVGTTSAMTRLLTVATPTRYIRPIITIPAGFRSAMVWYDFIVKKQK